MPIKEENQSNFYEHLFYNILSSLILIGIILFLSYVGIKGYVFQALILLVISWLLFFLSPLFMFFRPTAILFMRFMKDTPMLFPTMFLAVILQPIFFGPFKVVEGGGIPLSEFNETFFYVCFILVTLFASNCYKLLGLIFSTKEFQSIYIKILRWSGSKKSDTEITDAFDPKKNKNYWVEIKNLTYFILTFQIFLVIFPIIILMFIFQEIIPVPFLQYLFGTIIFFSGTLMAIGGLRIFISTYERYVLKKHKVIV